MEFFSFSRSCYRDPPAAAKCRIYRSRTRTMAIAAKARKLVLALALFATGIDAKIYFQEKFEDGWESRWVKSTEWKSESEMGEWVHTAGKWYGDENDKGIQTSQDAKHYGLSSMMSEPFTQTGDLVLQYSLKTEEKVDCSGAYIKLAAKADQAVRIESLSFFCCAAFLLFIFNPFVIFIMTSLFILCSAASPVLWRRHSISDHVWSRYMWWHEAGARNLQLRGKR